MTLDLNEQPHRRWNPLTREWILVSPHRSKRPWQGQVEKQAPAGRPAYDPDCYLCPGNERASGEVNPLYESTFVFTNDFGALTRSENTGFYSPTSFIKAESESGICKVICFSPRHDLTLPEMELSAIDKVVLLWQEQYHELGAYPDIGHVQIFENKGLIMGCSNPHPHGQIWAQTSLPVEPQKKDMAQSDYYGIHKKSLLSDYLDFELRQNDRIIKESKHFVALIPFWASWPYETMIIPKKKHASILTLSDSERKDFAEILQHTLVKFDNLFEVSFPYSAGIHQAPTNGEKQDHWHFHMVFYPPLLRSATVKKFMVGYEMLGNPQRDITAESAAAQLRGLPETHFKKST